MNEAFVHWLSPLDETGLSYVLERADYARQIKEGQGVLIGYAHDVDYPDHWNMMWLSAHLENFFYICLLYTSPSPRDQRGSRMPSSA